MAVSLIKNKRLSNLKIGNLIKMDCWQSDLKNKKSWHKFLKFWGCQFGLKNNKLP